jgi:hypothetical protein
LYGVVVVVPFSFQVLDLGVLLILLRRGWLWWIKGAISQISCVPSLSPLGESLEENNFVIFQSLMSTCFTSSTSVKLHK